VCDDEVTEGAKPRPTFRFEGTPAQTFQQLVDQCHDNKIHSLRRLAIRVEGMGKDPARDARSLGLAIPQIGKVTINLDQKMVLEFGGGEKFAIEFAGSWDRYKRIKALTDALSQEAAQASVDLLVRAEFDGGLDIKGDQFQTIRDVLVNLNIGRVTVEAEAMEASSSDG
jgi:hypothetical protein